MSDIAAYLKSSQLLITEMKLTSEELAVLISSIKSGVISGKIGKEVDRWCCSYLYFLTDFNQSTSVCCI